MTTEGAELTRKRRQWRAMAAEREGTLLFETSGDSHAGRSYLFRDPIQTLTADDEASLNSLFEELSRAQQAGYYVAGLLRYEAGRFFERVRSHPASREPLAWFGIYREPEIDTSTPSFASSLLSQPLCLSMQTSRSEYLRRVAAVKRYIEAGDTYQVNLTTAVRCTYPGDVLDLYNALSEQQPAPFSALLHLPDDEFVLSFSPELFFSSDSRGGITTRPMKGTAAHGKDQGTAAAESSWLAHDEKNRAEHLMIVDLLRNDLGRLCHPGSIHADPLFAIERYRTLLQMTSTISGSLRGNVPLLEIFRALFPSGSMTGAPKPRTMELIAQLERSPRGLYSGAIGFAAPDHTAVFSVAIRTVELKQRMLRMGVGSGIVADSVADQELAECWLKCEFLRRASPKFSLVETLLWSDSFLFLSGHLDRLQASAEALGFGFDRTEVQQHLLQAVAEAIEPLRVRLVLDRSGLIEVTKEQAQTWSFPLQIRLHPEATWSQDSFLRHKTTFRPLYDSALSEAKNGGFDEVIFANERQQLTEGAISSLLVHIGGVWKTPPLHCGVLSGVARSRLLGTGQVEEGVLTTRDLEGADALAVCNAVRGVGHVRRLHLEDGRTRDFSLPGSPARGLLTL